MPFIQMVEQSRSKLRLNDVKPPVLIGVVALVIAMSVVVGVNACSAFSLGGFVVSKSEDSAGMDLESPKLGASSGSRDGKVSDSSGIQDAAASASSEIDVTVYVCGQVQNPGVYTFKQGDRLQDAVNAAGGFSADASEDALNLARVLQDGEQVRVPSIEELSDPTAGQGSGGAVNPSEGQSQDGGLVSINTATASELETLPGIGQATAAKIIASREGEGPFQTVEDLMRVSGIGEKKFEALKDLICL